MLKKIILASGLLIASQSVFAELVIVVNPANTNAIDAKQIKRIFLGKDKKFPDGSESIPVNQLQESTLRQEFDESVLGRSQVRYQHIGQSLYLQAKVFHLKK